MNVASGAPVHQPNPEPSLRPGPGRPSVAVLAPSVDDRPGEAGWTSPPDMADLRAALIRLAPDLADAPISWHPQHLGEGSPLDARGAASVGTDHVLEFCWSVEAAGNLDKQGVLMEVLAGGNHGVRVPRPVARMTAPAVLLRTRVPGVPLTREGARSLAPAGRRSLARDLAATLIGLHDPATLTAARACVALEAARPGATTAELRSRLLFRGVDHDLRHWLDARLDRVDTVLSGPTDEVLVHGGLRGSDLVLSEDLSSLRAVLGFAEAGFGDYHCDFGYLPAQTPTLDLLREVIAAYRSATGREVELSRVMAWHTLNDLGAPPPTEPGVAPVSTADRLTEHRRLLNSAGNP